jgi:hypothetical protein
MLQPDKDACFVAISAASMLQTINAFMGPSDFIAVVNTCFKSVPNALTKARAC